MSIAAKIERGIGGSKELLGASDLPMVKENLEVTKEASPVIKKDKQEKVILRSSSPRKGGKWMDKRESSSPFKGNIEGVSKEFREKKGDVSKESKGDDLVGKRITAYWNNKRWYPGTVKRAIKSKKGTHTVQYDDESQSSNDKASQVVVDSSEKREAAVVSKKIGTPKKKIQKANIVQKKNKIKRKEESSSDSSDEDSKSDSSDGSES
jgi:hypothetical protein